MGFARKLKDIIGKFKPSDIGPIDSPLSDGDGILTNEMIMKELINQFKITLKQESLGTRMLYHMSYTILMDKDDYNERKDAFDFIVEQAVFKFYEIIRDKRSDYQQYEPKSNIWHFQFYPCYEKIVKDVTITPGVARVMSRLLPPNDGGGSNISVETNVRVSLRLDNSNVASSVYLNPNVLKNIDSVGEGTFRVRFDRNLNADNKSIKLATEEDNAIAYLSYEVGVEKHTWPMEDNLAHISGSGETRKGRAFLILPNANVKDSHLQIRCDNGKFQIAAFGPARLNGRHMQESSGIPQWMDLANKSRIFIENAMLTINFEIKQK